ncbi:uncharacterized protein C2orf42 homolog isoform X2 [Topomyia yanbarensis]|uniref:uncharacterized protein C2orf42 homolog isoform X2 n=1 Tax=Topomyia yanbarensis TaxID=2498891 RepID=UPI00273B4B27|nr:uncharacterized protein C2orf42 homolog isoform X2 [Topomyia yanbarensis]
MSFKLESRCNKRGIKKCPKCGTYNGHRASSCKNKTCRHILSVPKTSRAASGSDYFAAVQVKHYSQEQSTKLFSVRKLNGTKMVRGFVEIRDESDEPLLQLRTAICYVDCRPHTDHEGTCQHVRVASEANETAEELVIQQQCLDMLNVTIDVREAIWKQQLSCSTENGPLVQKVSADTFVVRCDDEFHQPVPFCHVQLKHPDSIIYDCQILDTYEGGSSCYHAFIVAAAILSAPKYYPVFRQVISHLLTPTGKAFAPSEISIVDSAILFSNNSTAQCSLLEELTTVKSCDQFLVATIQEPQSDGQISFKSEQIATDFIDPSIEDNGPRSPIIELVNSTENSICATETFAASYDDNLQLMDCQIELMDQFNLTDRIDFCPSDVELSDDNLVFPVENALDNEAIDDVEPQTEPSSSKKSTKERSKLVEVTTKKSALRQTAKISKDKMKKGSYNVRRLMKILESNGVVFNRLKQREAVEMAAQADSSYTAESLPSYEATRCSLSFTHWLESVIEQLNSVIEYGGNGKPEVQIFTIHENFFKCLRARFSVGHQLRMPDHSIELTGTQRKGRTCQVFKFTCYKSLRHVFKTDKIALKFEKSFCRTATGIYEEIDLSNVPVSHAFASKADTDGKVHYFVIEWIAGVLPSSGFGEMRITLEYGHKENHMYVNPPKIVDTEDGLSALIESNS